MKLKDWQAMKHPIDKLIVQASEPDGSDSWQPFPIGMSWQFGYVADTWNSVGTHDKTVLCAVQTWTDKGRRGGEPVNRSAIVKTLTDNGIPNQELDFLAYYSALPSYKFIVSPEGNGIDCHRTYEALMAGAIPILEERPEVAEKYRGCPVLFTKDYSEITETYLLEKYDSMIQTEYDFSRLYVDAYTEDEQFTLKYNGNFWMRRFFSSHPMWYSSAS